MNIGLDTIALTTPRKNKRVTAAKGTMLMFKRGILDDIDGILFYDHFKNYFEDIDLCIRAGKAGWETLFVDTPPIDHLCGRTAGHVPNYDIWAQYFRNILFSFHHNFGLFGHLFTIPCFALAAFVKSPRALMKAVKMLARGQSDKRDQSDISDQRDSRDSRDMGDKHVARSLALVSIVSLWSLPSLMSLLKGVYHG